MNFRPFNIGVTVVAVPFALFVAVTDVGRLPQAAPSLSSYGSSFKPRPDEQRRYGFGDIGYGCKEPGFEGYVQPDHPICVRGPFLRASASQEGTGE